MGCSRRGSCRGRQRQGGGGPLQGGHVTAPSCQLQIDRQAPPQRCRVLARGFAVAVACMVKLSTLDDVVCCMTGNLSIAKAGNLLCC